MATTLEIFMYKEEVTNLIRRVFPETKHHRNEENSFIYTYHEGEEYNVTFLKDLSYFIQVGVAPSRVACCIMQELVNAIIKGERE